MPATLTQRWTFTQPSPLGDVTSSYELTPEGLHFRSDAPMGMGSELLRWHEIAEAGTAALDVVWESPENIPHLDELRAPDLWLARVHGARV